MDKEMYYDEEEVVIKPPYWMVEYIDDEGHKHIATIKDKNYLDYLKDRYDIQNIEVVEA